MQRAFTIKVKAGSNTALGIDNDHSRNSEEKLNEISESQNKPKREKNRSKNKRHQDGERKC